MGDHSKLENAMRRPILALFYFLWLLLAATAAQAQERGALFKAQANGNTMYLFGTIHVGAPGFFPLEPRIEAALGSASVLALEVDTERDLPAAMRAMQQHAMVAPGSNVYGPLTPASRERLRRALQRASLDEATALAFKPWMVSTLLAVAEFGLHGFRPELSVDSYLARTARAKKVRIEELESVGAQLALFDRLDMVAQRKMLEETVDALESGKQDKEVRDMIAAWQQADREGLDRVLAGLERENTNTARFFRDVLLDERNVGMADKLAALLAREKSSVAAVGVLHLLGKRGVPELMRAKGIKMERVY
jgi:uncharacterized protein YbaP (TraB family)